MGSAVGRDEDRQAKAGQMVQRLINPDQGPEPRMVRCHIEGRGAEPLGAIDRDVDEEVDDRDEPESWRDDQDQRHRDHQVDQAVHQKRQRPAGLLILAVRHPGGLQHEVGDDVLNGKQ